MLSKSPEKGGNLMAPITEIEKNRAKSGTGLAKATQQGAEEADTPEACIRLPVALRDDVTLSVEAARKMQQMLDDAEHPAHSGKEMPTADPSVLLDKPQ